MLLIFIGKNTFIFTNNFHVCKYTEKKLFCSALIVERAIPAKQSISKNISTAPAHQFIVIIHSCTSSNVVMYERMKPISKMRRPKQ